MNENETLCFDDLGHYGKTIVVDTGCALSDATKVEVLMRDFVLHSTLDWLSRAQFRRVAREAYELLQAERPMFDDYFAQTRRAYEEMKAANEHRVLDVQTETHA